MQLKKHKYGSLFYNPVDYVGLNLQDYLDIISRPMSLTAVMNKLNMYEYDKVGDVLADIQLIFDNCKLFNGSSDPYFGYAQECEALFDELAARLDIPFEYNLDVEYNTVVCLLHQAHPIHQLQARRIISSMLAKDEEDVSVADLKLSIELCQAVHHFLLRSQQVSGVSA